MPFEYTPLLPLLAILTSALFAKRPNVRDALTVAIAAFTFGKLVGMAPSVLSGTVYSATLVEFVPGISLAFRIDALGMLFALVASGLWIVTTLYGMGYMRGLNEHGQARFFAFFAVAISATLAAAFSANLLTLYVFYEVLSLSTYPLVTHHGCKSARSGGRTYLTYLLGTSVALLLPALIWLAWQSGSATGLNFGTPGGLLPAGIGYQGALVLLLAFVFGFAKAGIMPLHAWLPGAMVAPTPVSALLHAVAVVKVGVFCIVRVVADVFGIAALQNLNLGIILASIASVTIIASSLMALSQDNLKRRLAFSTIGQLSYIVLGIALLSPAAAAGSVAHIAMHALGKITLFMCAGAIFVATGKKYVSQLAGLGRKMPFTFMAFAIGALSVTGLPLTGGFISKWLLLTGSIQAHHIVFAVVLLISTLLNAVYLLQPVWNAFFATPANALEAQLLGSNTTGKRTRLREAPLLCVLPICTTAALTVCFFFYPAPILQFASLFAENIF